MQSKICAKEDGWLTAPPQWHQPHRDCPLHPHWLLILPIDVGVESEMEPQWLLSNLGGRDEYRIELYRHDPGTEFEGKFREGIVEDNIINVITEARRHTSNQAVEAYHARQQ